MGYGHPIALRSRIIDAVEAGASARAAARRFAISASSSINLVRRWHETGSFEPGQVGGQKKRKLAGWEDWLHTVMALEPDVTLAELQRRLSGEGVEISQQAINTTLRALGYSYKKNAPGGGTGSRRRCAKTQALEPVAKLARSGTSCLHRRDRG